MNRMLAMSEASTTFAPPLGPMPGRAAAFAQRCEAALPVGYLTAVTPALEGALASAHEAGHQRAVRILHAVLAILDDPSLR